MHRIRKVRQLTREIYLEMHMKKPNFDRVAMVFKFLALYRLLVKIFVVIITR